jgi:PAS domain S-box-containing protein
MSKELNVLICEDNEDDALLLIRELKKGGYKPNYVIVDTEDSMRDKLLKRKWDIIISDYSMPGFRGDKALEVIQESEVDLPFILVSGTAGENIAVDMMKAGAHDYIMKDNLTRLLPAIKRELREAENRRIQRQAQKALEESEERFRTLVSNIPGIVYRCDLDEHWTMNFLSDAMYKLSGYPASDFIGNQERSYASIIHPDDQNLVNDLILNAVESNTPFEIDYRIIRDDGSICWVHENGTIVRNEKNEVICLDGVILDISEKKKAENALKESVEWFRSIFEESPIAINVYDCDGNLIAANRACLEFTGVSSLSDMKGFNIFEDSNLPDYVKEKMQNGVRVFFETTFDFSKIVAEGLYDTNKSGIAYVQSAISPLRYGENGSQQGYLVQIVDITELKQATEALKTSEEKYRTLVQSIHDMVFVYDIYDRHSDYYASEDSILIASPEEFLNKHVRDVLPPNAAERYIDLSRKVRNTGNPQSFDYALAIDGDLHWFSANLSLHEDGESIVSVVRDITKRKLAERALRESEEKYRAVVNQSVQGIAILQGPDSKIVFANPALLTITGYSEEELLNFSRGDLKTIVHTNDQQLVMKRFDARIEGKQVPPSMEFRIKRKDDAEAWLQLTAKRIKFQGQPAILASYLDITERKRAEEALKESEEKYRSLIQHSQQGILIAKGPPMKFVFTNPAISEILGYSNEELLSLSSDEIAQIIHQDDRETVLNRFEKLFDGFDVPSRYEFRAIKKDGSMIWLILSSTLIQFEREPALQVTILDNTDAKKAEEDLRAAADTAMLYLDLMGHDLRNHLQAIVMGTDILKHQELGAEFDPVYELIVDSINNSQNLIRKVQATRGFLSAPLSSQDLCQIIKECLSKIKRSYDDVDVRITSEIKKSVVKADEYFELLWMNILENAIVHNSSKTRKVCIKARCVKHGYEISISDNGPGISEEKKEAIFDPNRRYGGIGLHQAIKLVQKYGGKISIHDRVEGDSSKGSEFKVWLPKYEGIK